LFKWNLQIMPNTPYTMIDVGTEDGVGGGMQTKAMPKAPTGWLPYVLVDDVKKTVTKARKMGARIMVPYQQLPGMGAMGIFVDPTGGILGVWQPEMKPARRTAKATPKKAKKAAHRTTGRQTTRR
jgi:hypothetical protein